MLYYMLYLLHTQLIVSYWVLFLKCLGISKHSHSVIMVAYCTLDFHSLKSHSIRQSGRHLSKPSHNEFSSDRFLCTSNALRAFLEFILWSLSWSSMQEWVSAPKLCDAGVGIFGFSMLVVIFCFYSARILPPLDKALSPSHPHSDFFIPPLLSPLPHFTLGTHWHTDG